MAQLQTLGSRTGGPVKLCRSCFLGLGPEETPPKILYILAVPGIDTNKSGEEVMDR